MKTKDSKHGQRSRGRPSRISSTRGPTPPSLTVILRGRRYLIQTASPDRVGTTIYQQGSSIPVISGSAWNERRTEIVTALDRMVRRAVSVTWMGPGSALTAQNLVIPGMDYSLRGHDPATAILHRQQMVLELYQHPGALRFVESRVIVTIGEKASTLYQDGRLSIGLADGSTLVLRVLSWSDADVMKAMYRRTYD